MVSPLVQDFADVVNSDYFQKSPTRSGEVPEPSSIYSVEFVDSIALVRKRMRKPAHTFYGGVHDPDYLASGVPHSNFDPIELIQCSRTAWFR